MSKKGSLLHSFSLVAAANFITKPLWLVLFIFAARSLGTYQFGIYTYSISIVIILSILIDFGLDYIAVRDISVNNNFFPKYFNVVFIYRLSAIVIFLLSLALCYYFKLFTPIVFYSLVILLIFQGLVIVLQFIRSVISAFNDFNLYSKMLVFEKITIVIFGFIILFINKSIIPFLLSLMVGNIVTLVYFIWILKSKYNYKFLYPDKEAFHYLFKSSLPLVLMNVFIMAYFRVDVIILDWIIKDKNIIGIYGSIHRIIEMYFLIPTIIMSTAYPIISKKFSEDKEYVINLIERLLNYITIISLPIAVIIAFNSYQINILLFGNDYKSGYAGLIFLIWTIIPLGFNYIMGHSLISINKQKYNAVSLSVASIINIVINILLIPKLSFAGTCISLLITETVIFLFYSFYLNKYLGDIKILNLSIKILSIIAILFVFFESVLLILNYNFIIYSLLMGAATIGLMLLFKIIETDLIVSKLKKKII